MDRLRRALLFQLGSLALAAGVTAWAAQHYPVMAGVLHMQKTVGAMGFWGAVLYPLLYGACNVLLLPGGVLAIGSGLFFGLWWGFVLNVVANVIGAACAFLISRTFGRRWIARRLLRHPKWAALDEAIDAEGWKIILLSQLPPLSPVSLLNYLYGITRIRLGTCLLWVGIGQMPTMFLYAYLGTTAQFGLRLWRGEGHAQPQDYVLWVAGLALTLVATVALGRIALRALASAEAAAGADSAARRRARALEAPVIEAEVR